MPGPRGISLRPSDFVVIFATMSGYLSQHRSSRGTVKVPVTGRNAVYPTLPGATRRR